MVKSRRERKNSRQNPGKFGIGSIFKAIMSEQEEYDPKKHGPLVDLVLPAKTRY